MQSVFEGIVQSFGDDMEQEFVLSFLQFTMIILMNTVTGVLMCYALNIYGTAIVILPILIERMKNKT
jgi:hypothetical protein